MLLYKGRHLMILAYQPAALLMVNLHRYACLCNTNMDFPLTFFSVILGSLNRDGRICNRAISHFA